MYTVIILNSKQKAKQYKENLTAKLQNSNQILPYALSIYICICMCKANEGVVVVAAGLA